MSELVANCPRCKAKEMTFDLISQIPTVKKYGWQDWYEAFCICRNCNRSTTFVLSQKELDHSEIIEQGLSKIPYSVNQLMRVEGHISLKDIATEQPPEHIPENIDAAFREGAACLAIDCINAAGTMFRLCLDLATRTMLPKENTEGLNAKTRRDLGLRLPWLFDNDILPKSLREFSDCIKEDGNDGAHKGTLSEEDAEDIFDFCRIMLERIYTEPKRVELAKERRASRREATS